MVDREKMLNVRMTEAEMDLLRALSEHWGLSQSDTVRQLIRRTHASEGLQSGKRRKKK